MSPVPIPSIQKCIEMLGENEGKALHRELLDSKFRLAASLLDQINFLRQICPGFTVRVIIKLLGISNDRYYAALKNCEKLSQEQITPPSQRLLTDDEENEIISNIYIQQTQNDCLTGKEIRALATELYERRTGVKKQFTRDWFMDFKNRKKETIEKVSASSIDDERANISIEDVNRYFDQIGQMMKDPPHPFLLINYDEIGFGKRSEKGKRKNVYIIKNAKFKPYWREQTDAHHVSVVVGISAACCSLTPLFLSTRKKLDDDLYDALFLRSCNYFQTRKGYMTILSTVVWVRNCLAPYVEFVRSIIGQEQRCLIITDGLKAHFHQIVLDELEKIGNISVIPIPSHSSHLAQMLDVSVFNVFKGNYMSTPSSSLYKSLFTRKLMHIKKAYQSTVTEELIKSGWEKAGFELVIDNGEITSYTFSEKFKDMLRAEALHKEPLEE